MTWLGIRSSSPVSLVTNPDAPLLNCRNTLSSVRACSCATEMLLLREFVMTLEILLKMFAAAFGSISGLPSLLLCEGENGCCW